MEPAVEEPLPAEDAPLVEPVLPQPAAPPLPDPLPPEPPVVEPVDPVELPAAVSFGSSPPVLPYPPTGWVSGVPGDDEPPPDPWPFQGSLGLFCIGPSPVLSDRVWRRAGVRRPRPDVRTPAPGVSHAPAVPSIGAGVRECGSA